MSNYLNPKFVFNLSLVAENLFLNENYEKSKRVLENFKINQDFYYWYKSKKEAQIITKTKSREEALNILSQNLTRLKIQMINLFMM